MSKTGVAIKGTVLSMKTYRLGCDFRVLVLVVALFALMGLSSVLLDCTAVRDCSTGCLLAADMEIEEPPPSDLEPSRPELEPPPTTYLEPSNPLIDDVPLADFERSAPEIEPTRPAHLEPAEPEIEEPVER